MAESSAGAGEVDTTSDLIAGWLGGAVGILVSNPLEVLKVRLQTQATPAAAATTAAIAASGHAAATQERVPSNRVGRSSPPPTTSTSTSSSSLSRQGATTAILHQAQQRPGLATLWRTEGVRFLFAGAAGPILGLAFIDSAFFGLYGRAMAELGQDRQDPNGLGRVFAAGAAAGGICAMLETPIEVVKCRAQVEQGTGQKLGSFKIARAIAKKEGLRGFYIGGLMTAIHDGISSGIFFWGYFVFRRLLRGEHPFTASDPNPNLTTLADTPAPLPPRAQDRCEILRILFAGGLAGALSAVLPYPFDIIKTRLQTANFEARGPATHTTPIYTTATTTASRLTIGSVAKGIHADGVAAWRYRYSSTFLYNFISTYVYKSRERAGPKLVDGRPAPDKRAEKLTLRILGLRGFLRGIRPTVVSSFVGTTFEVALRALGVQGGGGGGVG
ncbi:hypothetical protein OIV83_004511 [Microbotryomycetes sp. JL201]|nr:hypothetical protein OIV83_004511 [Microbotryomycetes sp. JL201]